MPPDTTSELINIIGIGRVYANALARVGIRTVEDLAHSTAGELASALTEAGRPVAVERIVSNNWIGQAKRLLQEMDARQEAGTAANPGTQPVQHAAFSIFFDHDEINDRWQTRIYHEESGHEVSLDGLHPDAWIEYVTRRAQLPLEGAGATGTTVPTEGTTSSPALDITAVKVTTSSAPQSRYEPWLTITVEFTIRERMAQRDDAGDLAYLAEVLVINQASRELRTIVSRYGRLEAGVRSYGATVELPMPVVGRYSLESVVVLFPPVDVVANHAGPTLNITA